MKGANTLRGMLGRVFFNQGGRLRAPWLLALGFALYFLWSRGASLGLAAAFARLFSVWGLTEANLPQAPGWARIIYNTCGAVVSLVVSLGVIALSRLLIRAFRGQNVRPRPDWRAFGIGFGAGALAVLAGAAVFILTDCMRVDPKASGGIHGEILLFLPVYLAAACAEEAFDRAFVLEAVSGLLKKRRGGAHLACGLSALALLLTGGSLSLGVFGAVNLLLMGYLCAWLHLRGHGSVSVGLRFAWGYVSVALVNFPGGNAASWPLIALYHVSESWLTGGNQGLIAGIWTTLALALGLIGLWLWQKKRGGMNEGE